MEEHRYMEGLEDFHRELSFKIKPFAENKDQRGFVVHHISCELNGEEIGYIKVSYVDKKRYEELIGDNVWAFRSKVTGHCDLPEEMFHKPIEEINEWYHKNYSCYSEEHGSLELNKSKVEKYWFEHYFVNKPIVDFIRVHDEYRRHGVGLLLYMVAIDWLKKEFGFKLYLSTCRSDAAKKFHAGEITRKILRKRTERKVKKSKSLPYVNSYLNVERQYCLHTNFMKYILCTKSIESGVEK
jgi:GNAT superfamily N-acetyltransferase